MTNKYGLIGKNIAYSKSPKIHKFMAEKLNLDMIYELIDIEEEELPRLMKQLRSGIYRGFNVTTPYKQLICKYLDELTPKAKRIQAVNTIYIKNDKVIGDNTDYDGFIGLLLTHHIDVKGKNVYILGSGGAAKSVYIALMDLMADVTVVVRKVAEDTSFFHKVITYDQINPKKVDLYIQTTPIGTHPNVFDSVLDSEYVKNHIVIDLIYNPPVTQIMKDSQLGINGLNMLIIQALKSEEIWFSRKIEWTTLLMNALKEVIYSE
ncbi:MAG: shikimate dehydrogenase [Acholeplasmataceae bacterium]|nr:shikimate dehydrogenase [Acholeplasmataceae bacterium]